MGRGAGDGDGDGDARASDARGPATPAALEAWMEARGSMLPNVDVTVVFGRHFHLSGYPPWQLHKAEMYHRRSLRGFTKRAWGRFCGGTRGCRSGSGGERVTRERSTSSRVEDLMDQLRESPSLSAR